MQERESSASTGGWNAHHVSFDEVETERDLLDTFVDAVDALLGVGEDDVGFLVEARQGALKRKR